MLGAGDRPPVLLLTTWQIAPSVIWKMQVPHLARFFRVITYDPPGIGGGERTEDPAPFELDRVVDYGIALLDHLDVAAASVVGLSMGGAYGLWMAGRYPERVTRLVAIATVPPEWAFGGTAGCVWPQPAGDVGGGKAEPVVDEALLRAYHDHQVIRKQGEGRP